MFFCGKYFEESAVAVTSGSAMFASILLVANNLNVFATLTYETWTNIAKDGLWGKFLNIFTLIVTDGDKSLVGSCMSVSGLLRAVSGTAAGSFLIDVQVLIAIKSLYPQL